MARTSRPPLRTRPIRTAIARLPFVWESITVHRIPVKGAWVSPHIFTIVASGAVARPIRQTLQPLVPPRAVGGEVIASAQPSWPCGVDRPLRSVYRGCVLKYRMLAIDLDGTLFDSRGEVSPANVQAVRRARDAGLMVVPCTGRGLVEAQGAIRALDHCDPIVLASGALIRDTAAQRTLHRAVIEPNLAWDVTEHLRVHPLRNHGDAGAAEQSGEEGDAVLVLLDPGTTDHDYLVLGREQGLSGNTRWWFEMIDARVRFVEQPADGLVHDALRVGIVGPESHMPPVRQSLVETFGERISTHHFMAVKGDWVREGAEDVHVLEVFSGGVNKWSALERLARSHDIEPGEVAAIGDHVNDLAMVEHAGCGIAMGNAVDPLEAVARRQTRSNDEDGVAWAIERLLEGEW